MNKATLVRERLILVISEDAEFIDVIYRELKETNFNLIFVTSKRRDIKDKFEGQERIGFFENINEFNNSFKQVDYLIYFKSLLNSSYFIKPKKLKQLDKDLSVYSSLVRTYKPKSMYVMYGLGDEEFTRKYEKQIKEHLNKNGEYSGIIYCGDVVGSTKSKTESNYLSYVLQKSFQRKTIEVNNQQLFYPISIKDLVVQLNKVLFSLKGYGKRTAIFGSPVRAGSFVKVLNMSDKVLKLNNNQALLKLLDYDEEIIVKRRSTDNIKKEYKNIIENAKKSDSIWSFIKNLNSGAFVKKVKFSKFFPNKKTLALVIGLIALTLPITLLATSLLFLTISKALLVKGYLSGSENVAQSSYFLARSNSNYITATSKVPLFGMYFKSYTRSSSLMLEETETAIVGLKIIRSLDNAIQTITTKKNFDVLKISKELSIDLGMLYQKLGFLETELSEGHLITQVLSFPIKKTSFFSLREKVLLLKELSEDLPKLLDENGSIFLAIFFQNSHLLRPTGGRIEAFTLANVTSTKIESLTTDDVSFADKKFNGRIEPPEALKDYFNLDEWYLRDMNWDPDLSSTSKHTESFLESVLDVNVDGVIMVDDSLILEIMGILGLNKGNNLRENDWLLEGVNSDLAYPYTEEMFPLTVLIKGLVSSEVRTREPQRLAILNTLFKGFEKKNLQVYFKDEEVEKRFIKSGWGGSFVTNKCYENCFADFVSIVEFAYQGNSKNVEKEAQLSVSFEEKVIKRKLTLYAENKNEDLYKTYVRVFVNPRSSISPVTISDINGSKTVEPEISAAGNLKQAGVYLELMSGESVAVDFVWETEFQLDLKNKGEYQFLWKKQAGDIPYKIDFNAYTPKNLVVFSEPEFFLTDGEGLRYNTTLAKDASLRIFW